MIKNLLAQFNLRQPLSRREGIIFFVTILTFAIGIVKVDWIDAGSSIAAAKQQIDALNIQKEQLEKILMPTLARKAPYKLVGIKIDLDTAEARVIEPLRENGVAMIKAQFSDIIVGDVSSRTAQLSLIGEFGSILQYVKYIELMPTPFVIESFFLAPTAGNQGLVTLDIKGAFYAS